MRTFVGLLKGLLTLVLISVASSAAFAFSYWLIGIIFNKEHDFLMNFLWGAIGIFLGLLVLGAVRVVLNLIRFKKDPLFKQMFYDANMDWRTYKQYRRETFGDHT